MARIAWDRFKGSSEAYVFSLPPHDVGARLMNSEDLRILEIDGKFVVAVHRNQAWSQLTWHHTRADAQRDLAILSLAPPSREVGRAAPGTESR